MTGVKPEERTTKRGAKIWINRPSFSHVSWSLCLLLGPSTGQGSKQYIFMLKVYAE